MNPKMGIYNFSTMIYAQNDSINLLTNDGGSDWWARGMIGFILCTFTVICVFGNVLVVVAVMTKHYLHTPTSYLIVNMAIADLIVGCVVMPIGATKFLTQSWPFNNLPFCDVWHSLDILASTASIWNLCVISLDRYLAVRDPINYREYATTQRVVGAIVLVWLASALISFPAITWWHHSSPLLYTDPTKCSFTDDVAYIIFSSSVSFYIPLLVTLFAYYRVFVKASKQERSLRLGRKKIKQHHHSVYGGMKNNNRGGGGGGNGTGAERKKSAAASCGPPVNEYMRIHRGGAAAGSSSATNSRKNSQFIYYNAGGGGTVSENSSLHYNPKKKLSTSNMQINPNNSNNNISNNNNGYNNNNNATVSNNNNNNDDNNRHRRFRNASVPELPNISLNDNQIQISAQIPTNNSAGGNDNNFYHRHQYQQQLVINSPALPVKEIHRTVSQSSNLSKLSHHSEANLSQTETAALLDEALKKADREDEIAIERDRIRSLIRTNPSLQQQQQQEKPQNQQQSGSSQCQYGRRGENQLVIPPSQKTSITFNQSPFTAINPTMSVKRKITRSQIFVKLVKEKRAAKTLGLVVGCFILCWLPFFVVNILIVVCDSCLPNPDATFMLVTWLGYCNSWLNPIIYSTMSRDFKRAFKEILFGGRQRGFTARKGLAIAVEGSLSLMFLKYNQQQQNQNQNQQRH